MRRPLPRSGPGNLSVVLLTVSFVAAVTGAQCTRDDALPALSLTSEPLLTSATARTVTDERAVRLVPTIDKGPEVLAPRGNTPFQVSPSL